VPAGLIGSRGIAAGLGGGGLDDSIDGDSGDEDEYMSPDLGGGAGRE
jgi:hypothetical protein